MLNCSHYKKKIAPFLKWAGGKRWLVSNYEHLLPESYNRYIEPFLGSGAVFFHLAPRKAILSDINEELITTYIAIRDCWESVERELRLHQKRHCKEYYYEIRQYAPKIDYKRAARFIYLNRTCWNGLYRVNLQGQFNVPLGTKTSVITESDDFRGLSALLKNKNIQVSDFEEIIDHSKANDFVFIDPPYTVKHNLNGFVKYNEKLFSWDDQIRLKEAVVRASNRGANILILNANHNSIKELYSDIGTHAVLPRASILAADAKFRCATEELAILL